MSKALTTCSKCGKHITELHEGNYLHRVNELGQAPVMECRPNCGRGIHRTQDNALLDALEEAGGE